MAARMPNANMKEGTHRGVPLHYRYAISYTDLSPLLPFFPPQSFPMFSNCLEFLTLRRSGSILGPVNDYPSLSNVERLHGRTDVFAPVGLFLTEKAALVSRLLMGAALRVHGERLRNGTGEREKVTYIMNLVTSLYWA